MKKLVCLGGALLAVSVLLTGCSNAIPEMDEETQAMVVEYAAGVVQKHDKNHVSKLMELEELKKEEEAETEETEEKQPAASPENAEPEEAPQPDAEVIDNTQEEKTTYTLDEFLQLDNITFSYTEYEITPFYPTDDSEISFVMNATEGMELLILKFTARNLTQEEIALDINGMNTSYKISVNGSTANALFTMLLNDLSKYQGTLAGGESKELVLVREISPEEADNITSLSIQAKRDDMSAVIPLVETVVIVD